MPDTPSTIQAHLQAAEAALAAATGGSTELARVREAVAGLLAAVRQLAATPAAGAGSPRPAKPRQSAKQPKSPSEPLGGRSGGTVGGPLPGETQGGPTPPVGAGSSRAGKPSIPPAGGQAPKGGTVGGPKP